MFECFFTHTHIFHLDHFVLTWVYALSSCVCCLKLETCITPKLLDPQKSITPQSEAEDEPHTLRGMGMPRGPSPWGWGISLGQGSKTRKPSVTRTQQNFESL